MAQQLKRWESPRRAGRNHKGKGGSARKRQWLKRQQRLRQQLKQGSESSPTNPGLHQPERNPNSPVFL